MYDADALEAINADQLVTATDRLLLRGGQMSKRRHVRRFAEGSQPHIVVTRFAEGSQPNIAVQPYLGTIVAAPFSCAPHPAPPRCASHVAYLATAPNLACGARGAQSELADVAAVPFAADSYPAPHGRGSQPCLASIAVMPAASDASPRRTRGSQRSDRTAVIRRAAHPGVQVFAVTVVIPALVGMVVGLVALL
jgi:hypothetical protein